MSPETWCLLSGGTLLAAAACWRWLSHHRVHARLELAIRSGDPVLRQAGMRVAVEQGLRANAKRLLSCIDRESDPQVLSALADSVLRNTWEPADRPAMVQLRLWAHAYSPPKTAGQPSLVQRNTTAAPTRLLTQHHRGDSPRHRAADIKPLRIIEGNG